MAASWSRFHKWRGLVGLRSALAFFPSADFSRRRWARQGIPAVLGSSRFPKLQQHLSQVSSFIPLIKNVPA